MGTRPSLAEALADDLVNDVLAGRYPPNSPLPSETELADLTGVSRLTVREAVKALAAKGVVRVEHGRGTFVNPTSSWSVLDPVLLIARSSHEADRMALPRKLIEARRLVEVAVAQLAAERRTPEQVDEMASSLLGMRSAARVKDVTAFVQADILFHQQVMDAADNSFVTALFDPLARILRLTRHQTSSHSPVRSHAIAHHQRILDAIRTGDPAQAGAAMQQHMLQTERDMDHYVKDPASALLALRAGDLAARPRVRRSP